MNLVCVDMKMILLAFVKFPTESDPEIENTKAKASYQKFSNDVSFKSMKVILNFQAFLFATLISSMSWVHTNVPLSIVGIEIEKI